MKYLSVLVLLAGLVWTWFLTNSERAFSLEMHKTLEAEMQQLIVSYIKEKQPNVSEVTFSQLYTEIIKPERELRVHFRYNIDMPAQPGGSDATEQMFQGFVILRTEDGQNWRREGGELKASALRYSEGLRVYPGMPDVPDEMPETKGEPEPVRSAPAPTPTPAAAE